MTESEELLTLLYWYEISPGTVPTPQSVKDHPLYPKNGSCSDLYKAVKACVSAVNQKWQMTCKSCGTRVEWEAKDFLDAADKSPPGWSTDPVLKHLVCPKCKIT